MSSWLVNYSCLQNIRPWEAGAYIFIAPFWRVKSAPLFGVGFRFSRVFARIIDYIDYVTGIAHGGAHSIQISKNS